MTGILICIYIRLVTFISVCPFAKEIFYLNYYHVTGDHTLPDRTISVQREKCTGVKLFSLVPSKVLSSAYCLNFTTLLLLLPQKMADIYICNICI